MYKKLFSATLVVLLTLMFFACEDRSAKVERAVEEEQIVTPSETPSKTVPMECIIAAMPKELSLMTPVTSDQQVLAVIAVTGGDQVLKKTAVKMKVNDQEFEKTGSGKIGDVETIEFHLPLAIAATLKDNDTVNFEGVIEGADGNTASCSSQLTIKKIPYLKLKPPLSPDDDYYENKIAELGDMLGQLGVNLINTPLPASTTEVQPSESSEPAQAAAQLIFLPPTFTQDYLNVLSAVAAAISLNQHCVNLDDGYIRDPQSGICYKITGFEDIIFKIQVSNHADAGSYDDFQLEFCSLPMPDPIKFSDMGIKGLNAGEYKESSILNFMLKKEPSVFPGEFSSFSIKPVKKNKDIDALLIAGVELELKLKLEGKDEVVSIPIYRNPCLNRLIENEKKDGKWVEYYSESSLMGDIVVCNLSKTGDLSLGKYCTNIKCYDDKAGTDSSIYIDIVLRAPISYNATNQVLHMSDAVQLSYFSPYQGDAKKASTKLNWRIGDYDDFEAGMTTNYGFTLSYSWNNLFLKDNVLDGVFLGFDKSGEKWRWYSESMKTWIFNASPQVSLNKGFSNSSQYEWIADEGFPPTYEIGGNSTRTEVIPPDKDYDFFTILQFEFDSLPPGLQTIKFTSNPLLGNK